MRIDIPDALAVQDVVLDESQNFPAFGHCSSWQILKQLQDRRTIAQTSASHLADHERMHDDVRSFQQLDKLSVATAKMVDPH